MSNAYDELDLEIEEEAEEAEEEERTFVKPTTLDELLKALCLIDEAMLELDLEDQQVLMEDGKIKVDNYKYLKNKMDAMLVELKSKENEYRTARQSIEKQIDRLMSNMTKAMVDNGFEMFTGNQYKGSIRYYDSVAMQVAKPEDRHAIEFPELVRTTYSWNKKEITPLLKGKFPKEDKDRSELADKAKLIGKIESKPKVQFSVLKDL